MVRRGAKPKAIYDALRMKEDGFKGSLSALKRLVKRLRVAEEIKPEDVAIPVSIGVQYSPPESAVFLLGFRPISGGVAAGDGAGAVGVGGVVPGLESPAVFASLDDVAVVGEAIADTNFLKSCSTN